ncbi:hypothetical protein DRN73_10065 [Candidatus Pacearchaeota archaeon]|nr:MAG: hypothetical protein DRN73_10065 [Candidatus Pacearchaeota archaeon]
MSQKEKFALFFGILLGDGCLSEYVNKKGKKSFLISISGDYYSDKAFYSNILCLLINELRFNKKPIKIKERPNYGKLEILFSDKELFNKIKELNFPVGKKGPNLFIPDYFCERNLIRCIIAGFFATDGSLVLTKNPNKFYPRIEGTSISKKLINQIVNYLNTIGMKGYFYVAKRKKVDDWGFRQQAYRFQFNGIKNLLLFKKLISFVNPKHNKKFINFLRYNVQYDKTIQRVQTSKHKRIRKKINSKFLETMAALRVELRTPSS